MLYIRMSRLHYPGYKFVMLTRIELELNFEKKWNLKDKTEKDIKKQPKKYISHPTKPIV
jgi:hypothetical protein